ncbi:MAG TPA: FAD:protein FMN transferase [Solirubrobacteraceae bacterium]|nr:FAD:protein FMN transferase [Solirubrobacteraceae bacterium]
MGLAAPAEALGRAEFAIWGGHAVVAVTDQSGLSAALAHVKRTVAAFDLACSSFREDSELALLNQSPGEDVVVSRLLFDAVREAIRAARLTDGAVDPTVGQALVALHINPPLSDQPVRIEPVPGYAVVKLDEPNSSIRLPAGAQLDLGAMAKALAADVAASAARTAAGCGVLVGLCGDIAVAGEAPAGGWQIRVTDDHRNGDAPGQTVAIQAGGLTTSSVTVRRSADGPDAVHHLVNPGTGRPVDGPWRTVSVTAGCCADANTASTAAIVLGEQAPEWLEHNSLPARLVAHDGTVSYAAGWPAEGDDL